ncbi:MAG: 6-bladed beta-propeller, partial [Balneola sp.]
MDFLKINKMKKLYLFCFFVLLFCTKNDSSKISNESKDAVFIEDQNFRSILLVEDHVFESTEDIFISRMGDYAVDDSNRIFITDKAWGNRALHMFGWEGKYLGKFFGEGKGPGEFLDVSNLQIHKDLIIFYDAELFRLSEFSISNMKLEKTFRFDPSIWSNIPEIRGYMPVQFHTYSDGTYLVGFEITPNPSTSGKRVTKFYHLDKSLKLNPTKILEFDSKKHIWATNEIILGETKILPMKTFSFFKKTIIDILSNNNIVVVETDRLTIKYYSRDGDSLSQVFYNFNTPSVTRQDALDEATNLTKTIAEGTDLPTNWPVINQLIVDDKDNMWVSTFSNSKDSLKWIVFDQNGEIIGDFMWPGKMTSYPFEPESKKVIKNGYFYELKEDIVNFDKKIVRYKIF